MTPSISRGFRSHGGQRIADARGLQSFCSSVDTFINETQRLGIKMESLLEISSLVWRDDTAVTFLNSVRDVLSLLPPVVQNLQQRKENIEMQIALMNEYCE